MNRRLMLFSGLLALAVGGAANGTVLYDNLMAISYGADSISADGPLYDSFTTGSSVSVLTDVKLRLGGDPTDGGSLIVGLYSDSSTSPGALLATLGTIPDLILTPLPASVVHLSTSSVALSANTRYWIGLSTSALATEWAFSADTTGTGVSGEFVAINTSIYQNSSTSGPYQMEISVHSAPVPEPASFGLFAAGLIGVGVTCLRRKN